MRKHERRAAVHLMQGAGQEDGEPQDLDHSRRSLQRSWRLSQRVRVRGAGASTDDNAQSEQLAEGTLNGRPGVEWKGVTSFLLITFVVTYVAEGAVILSGVSPLAKGLGQYAVALVMWVPALATVLTTRFVTREGLGSTNIRLGSWRPYATVGLVVPACFVLIYGMTWLFGLGRPDWTLQHFKSLFETAGVAVPAMPSPFVIWPVLFVVTVFIAPFINSVFAFGEELGWRGYLLPKLLPLGKFRAYLLVGVIWGAWHWPLVLVGFMYPDHPLAGLLTFTALTTVFGIYLNELTLRHRSSTLAGWIHGVFNTQRLGMWALLFPNVDPWLGGFSGVVGIGVWFILGMRESRRLTT